MLIGRVEKERGNVLASHARISAEQIHHCPLAGHNGHIMMMWKYYHNAFCNSH